MVQIVQEPRIRVQGSAGEIKPVAMALGLAFGLGVGIAPAASAATITVNNLSGTSVVGQCTLRDAIQAANTNAAVQGCTAGSGADTINFSVIGTISLAQELQIDSDLIVAGPGPGSLTLAPSSSNRAIKVINNHTVSISGVTFQGNGTATVFGGAIYHYAGTLTISNCVFNGNVTTQNGGAIYNYGGTLNIQSSTFSGNRASKGGAIYLYGGNTTIQQSTFSGNTSTGSGGAIYLYQGASVSIVDSTLSGNRANGGSGGAIALYGSNGSTVTNSTISGNSSSGKGGAVVLYSGSSIDFYNSTVTGNTAGSAGGAFYLSDGGINSLGLNSTIVAKNVSGSGANDIDSNGTVGATNSLIMFPAGSINGTNVNNITGVDPLLGPLANNGGPTQTHALLAGSPAIDKGINSQALVFDQRGTPFARSSGVTDIGSFEVQGAGPPPPVASTPVPTLSQWSLALLSAMMAGWAMLTGFGKRRRS